MILKMLFVFAVLSLSTFVQAKTAVIGFKLDYCTRDSTTNSEIDGENGNSFRFLKILDQISGIDYKTIRGLSNGSYCGQPSTITYHWTFFDASDEKLEEVLKKYDGKNFETSAGRVRLNAKIVNIVANISVIYTNPSVKLTPIDAKFRSLKDLWSMYSSPFPENQVSDVCISTIKAHLLKFSPSIESSLNDFFKTWRGPGQNIGWRWEVSFLDENSQKMPLGFTEEFADYWVMWGKNCTQTKSGRLE